MHPTQLFDELKKRHSLTSDGAIAKLLGLTPGRVSQLRSGKKMLSAKQLCSFLKKTTESAVEATLQDAVRPAVEMYPIDATLSKQEKKWELLPTSKSDVRNVVIRKYLESIKGIYVLYDSQGCAIYAGKTEKGNIWAEMTNAFNRERSNHTAFFISHPVTGKSFAPAWQKPKQPIKKLVWLYDTAHYFSAYEAHPILIPKLEAFVIRAFCNNLSNKKMEKF